MMRHPLVVGLTLLAAAAVGADRPIPQDPDRMEKRARERLAWNRATLGGGYEKVGKKDPRWDRPAREALDIAARMFAQQWDPVLYPSDVHVPAKKAVDAGCDDPLIGYLYARSSVGKFSPGEAESARRLKAAADAMVASRYSPYRRAVALEMSTLSRAWNENLSPEDRRGAERAGDAILDLLTRSIAEDPRGVDWEDGWYTTINSVIQAHRQLGGGDYKAAFDRVDARLAKVAGIEALRLTVKGNFLQQWGWQARTTAFASRVTQEQFRTFEARLRQARAALIAAWKANPGQPHVADLMLANEKSIGAGDREAMETWFDRAMKADGNDREACWQKLDWLDPKWYGGDSPDEMMAFGRACRDTRNWHNGITLLAADAHLRYFGMLDPMDGRKYLRLPEVWSDITSVYDEYLKHRPDDDTERSKYAFLCYQAGYFREAHAQFQAVGDRLTTWPTFPNVPLRVLKMQRDETAKIVAAMPQGGVAPAPRNGNPR